VLVLRHLCGVLSSILSFVSCNIISLGFVLVRSMMYVGSFIKDYYILDIRPVDVVYNGR